MPTGYRPDRRDDSSSRGDATQETLLLGQAACHIHTLLAAHPEDFIQYGGVKHLRHKPCPDALYLDKTDQDSAGSR